MLSVFGSYMHEVYFSEGLEDMVRINVMKTRKCLL